MSRKVALLILVLAVAGAVAFLSRPASKPVVDPSSNGAVEVAASSRAPFERAEECGACHEDVFAEWAKSYHGMAWTDPMVRALSNGFRMTECIDCHAPMPIHVTGLSSRVVPRQHARGDGVDCITCHLMEDGISVAATRVVDTSKVAGACRPVLVPEMGRGEACSGCHNQHNTIDEVAQSGVPETCVDCHMPAVPRVVGEGAREGRSHAFPGAHSLEMHRRAAKLEVVVEEGYVVARVTNVGAAHHMPTDARHRSYNLFLSASDERGNTLVGDLPMEAGEFRLYYRDDFRESTQIAHQQTRESRWKIPEGLSGRAKVRLVYALNPEELAAGRVFEVAEQEVQFP